MAGNSARKLAAILSADVVGYSRLMHDDEAATVATLQEYRAAIGRVIDQHVGRIVNAPGDNILAEFPSAVEAVEAAVEIQRNIEGRNAELPDERRMQFRVGVNLGDVLEEKDGTIYGDGVNIAARMEALADEGGICIASPVYDAVEGKIEFGFDFLGEQQVKNISKPINVYRVRADSVAAVTPSKVRISLRTGLIGVAVTVILIVTGAVVWQVMQPPLTDPDVIAEKENQSAALPTGPSIAVLPFANRSDDPEQEYFSDGLTEDIINGLSLFNELFVIARNSTFRYKGTSVDVREISQDLGVRYVLEGSVRKSGDTIRVSAQLLDGSTGSLLWSEVYDRDLTVSNIFAVQDEITDQVVATIADAYGVIAQIGLEKSRSKGTESLAAYECVLRAYEHWRNLTAEGHLRARDCLEGAVELDPEYAEAWAWLAPLYRQEHVHKFNPRPDLYDPLDRALEAAQRAVDLDPMSQAAHHALADAHFFRKELVAFFVAAERAVELNPNNSDVLSSLGNRMSYAAEWNPTVGERVGKGAEGLQMVKKAMALNPYHPGWYYFPLAADHYLKREYEETLTEIQKINMPDFYWTQIYLVAAHGQMGHAGRAQEAINELLELRPEFLDEPRAPFVQWNMPDNVIDAFMDGLRKAGLEILDQPPATN